MRLQKRFIPAIIDKYSWRTENPIILLDASEPEPDFSLLTYREDDYASGHPTAKDVLLVMEVADQTLTKDQTIKAAVYANAGIAEYWIINLIDRQIEVYTQPSSTVAEYEKQAIYPESGQIEHPVLGSVLVRELLP